MKLNYKFGIYCFCTGVFLANCSPENNGGSSNNKKEILAAINNNKNISDQVKKHLEKSIEKENKITQVNQKILSTGSTKDIFNECCKASLKSNFNRMFDSMFNEISKQIYENNKRTRDILNEKYSLDEKNILSFLLHDGIKIPYEYAFLSYEEELDRLNDSKFFDFVKSNFKNMFTKDFLCGMLKQFSPGYQGTINDNDFEKIKRNVEKNIDRMIIYYKQCDFQNCFLIIFDGSQFDFKSIVDKTNKISEQDIQELLRNVKQNLEKNIQGIKEDIDSKNAKLSSKSEKIKDFLKTHKDYKQEDVASFQEMLQSL